MQNSYKCTMHMHMCKQQHAQTLAQVICANTCKHMLPHTHTHTPMHTLAMPNTHPQIHNVLNVCEREVPSVSYDHREFIEGERVLLPELKPTRHLLPKSKKDSENRQIFCLCVCLCVGVTHVQTHRIPQKVV